MQQVNLSAEVWGRSSRNRLLTMEGMQGLKTATLPLHAVQWQ
jgi:hypothetical protein